MDQFSTVVSKDQKSEEQAEGEGRDNEEIDGDNVANMRLKEGAPRRGWPRRGVPPHVLGNGEPSDLEAEEPEFRLDPAPAPSWVLSGDAADESAELKIERRATRSAAPGLPAPVDTEPLAMPCDDRWVDEDQARAPVRPEP
jgi:hypothetical protein